MTSDEASPRTRASLILRLRNPADLCAWREFAEIYQPVIHALARRRGLQPADADDVTQEVLAKVARLVGQWDPSPARGSFRGWLATVTRNLAVQHFRHQSRRGTLDAGSRIVELMDDAATRAQSAEFDLERDRQLFLWAARQVQTRFEPKTWRAFWMTAVDGVPAKSAAEQLGTTTAQVYVARSRVMRLLRQTVERSEFQAEPEG